mmetsp:Transcript_8393/g.23491  ORF Transcript_8393/g.23491 Transcript_8393/m.23491 type:complete len:221 (-) Transcript_8393:254-916(-)
MTSFTSDLRILLWNRHLEPPVIKGHKQGRSARTRQFSCRRAHRITLVRQVSLGRPFSVPPTRLITSASPPPGEPLVPAASENGRDAFVVQSPKPRGFPILNSSSSISPQRPSGVQPPRRACRHVISSAPRVKGSMKDTAWDQTPSSGPPRSRVVIMVGVSKNDKHSARMLPSPEHGSPSWRTAKGGSGGDGGGVGSVMAARNSRFRSCIVPCRNTGRVSM